jgi:S-adenosylmethionine:tRNA ribosyltransferase-isomerase
MDSLSTDLNALASYDYQLPEELIAQTPVSPRDHSRMLVYQRDMADTRHCRFYDLPEFLRPGDCLVLNQTRVVPARLYGVREQTGGKWEGLFLRRWDSGEWEIIGQTRGKLQPGETLLVGEDSAGRRLRLRLIARDEQGRWRVAPAPAPDDPTNTWDLLERYGSIPLPPYIQQGHANETDRERYQTVFAETPGAVAAPTAGLHFTPGLLARCQTMGVGIEYVTLHVGLGTFRPVSVEHLDEHDMHAEWCEIRPETVTRLQQIRSQGGRIIAVGTTSVRTLETAAQTGELLPWQGESNLFIRPGHPFRAVDGLITNFHLPKSTLLVLLAAFMGYAPMRSTYEIAIAQRYRFYSYGDAMLIT